MGNTIADYCGYLGALGADRDTASRHRLAALIKSDDPRLLAIADPMSRSIPAWVGNPNKSAIETCYGIAKEDIGRMLGRYGARPEENSKTRETHALTADDLAHFGTENARMFGDPFDYANGTFSNYRGGNTI